MDRRTVFFLVAATVCAVLAPEAGGYTWVAGMLAVVYGLLAVASWLEERSRKRS
jgi:hypothetical protein